MAKATDGKGGRKILLIALGLLAVTALIFLLQKIGLFRLSPDAFMIIRWLTIGAFVVYAFKKRNLTTFILVAMLVGAEMGNDFPKIAVQARLLSLIFLRMIKCIIAPLLFSTLVVGIAGHADLKQVGRLGVKSLVYFEIITTLALFIGLAAINLSQAGKGIVLPEAAKAESLAASQPQTFQDTVLHIFPENIAKSVAENQVLQVVIFAVFFGIALALVPEIKRKPLLNITESLAETMFKFTNIVMMFAPIGVGAAIANTVGHQGLGILKNLLKVLLTFYASAIVLILVVLLPIALLIKAPIKKFLKAIADPVALAFATTSSEAAMPRAMEAMEAIGVPRRIVAFVIPTGYSFNLDGSSLYLSLAGIFVAQAAGVHMSFGQQLLMVFTLMLTSKGVAGVPRASLVILLGTVATFKLPVEPVFILLGIDELMDMVRTSLNVFGNSFATVVMAIWEKQFGTEKPSATVKEALEERL